MGFELSSEIVLSLTVLESWFPLRFVGGTTQNVIFHLGLIKPVTVFLLHNSLSMMHCVKEYSPETSGLKWTL